MNATKEMRGHCVPDPRVAFGALPLEPLPDHNTRMLTNRILMVLAGVVLAAAPLVGQSQTIKAQARTGATPVWNKGILPISAESYYHAIDCGKQGGADPACVFWDTGVCKNPDFTIAMYTPYKQVAYEVWAAVRAKKPAPQPNYQAAQQTRVTVGLTAIAAAKNPLKDFVLRRGGKAVPPVFRSLENGGGRYTFDYPAFAATAPVTLDMVGQARTISCAIDVATLRSFR
jgi:hypothetical protein